MVTREEVDLHSPVHQGLKCCENPDIPLWNHVTVFIPEVPDITEHIKGFGFLRQTIQKRDKTRLAARRIGNLQSQMYI